MKRTIVTLVLVTLITVSATAFAALPTHSSTPAPANGASYAALTTFGLPYLYGEECPSPNDNGCG